ncbi:hypothetical protein LIER_17148 [Lithospermum erythrorhizon]|uniref:SGF29 C-terminal domain-containing protein n=1 Tax=Lithospermum erythrorhizon TaxID=34254 RepID=A0AAV3QDM0_LITER
MTRGRSKAEFQYVNGSFYYCSLDPIHPTDMVSFICYIPKAVVLLCTRCIQISDTRHSSTGFYFYSHNFFLAPEVVEKPGNNSLSKLKTLYTQAKELSESEVLVSNQLLGYLDLLIPPGAQGQQRRRLEGNEQKKKRMKADADTLKLSPSMRHLEALANLKGEQVAARIITEDGEKDEWLVVKVTHFDRDTRVFEVLDEEPGDDEEGAGQRKYRLPASHIIPFPKRNDLSSIQDFPPGKHVLALYPKTSALYKATVVQARKLTLPLTPRIFLVLPKYWRTMIVCIIKLHFVVFSYVLEFEDDEEEDGSLPQRSVPFHRVVALPEGHRQ